MKTLGQAGFDAYGDHANWKAFDDRPMPRWDDKLRPDIKEKWEVAAKAIIEANLDDRARKVIAEIVLDLSDRPGFSDTWVGLDVDARRELVNTWINKMRQVLSAP